MPGPGEADLDAILLPRPAAARAVHAAWDAGRAVLVLDPGAPEVVRDDLLRRLAPTHLVDTDGRRALPHGVPVTDDVAAVVVTSGTTGTSRGVELPRAGIEAVGRASIAVHGASSRDRWLVCVPLHHVAGLAILARASVSQTPCTVHTGFDPVAAAHAPRDVGATLVSMVPTMVRRVLDAGARLDGYRWVFTGGAPLGPSLRAEAEAGGAPVVDLYGLSETWGGFVADGVAIPGAEVRLHDHEIQVRGPMVLRRYRLAPDLTAAAFSADGWFRTGDVGRYDDRGRLHVVDRQRDLIITGGVNVSPTAVEQVLADHPDVDDVAVGGFPDPEWGERVVAYVVARDRPPSLADLRAYASDRLGAAQLPREVVAVAEIPRSPGGKILRRRLGPPGVGAP